MGVTLPIGNPNTDISPVPGRSAIVQTLSGAFDSDLGTEAAPDFPHSINYTAVAIDDTVAQWRTTEDALRALTGQRGWLYRRAEDNDEIQRAVCRLLAVTGPRAVVDRIWKNDTFEWLQLGYWRGHDHRTWRLDDGHVLDEGLYLDDGDTTYTYTTGPLLITASNGGNARVTDAIITITAGAVAITNTRILKSGETNLNYAGTIAPWTSLVIDCGAFSVLNNGVNDYANFTLPLIAPPHTINEWLRLTPGDNTLSFTLSGPSGAAPATIKIEFMDAWK